MLDVGEIVKGPFWSEIVEIKKCELIDDALYVVEAIGRQSSQFYETYLEDYQLEQLERLQQKTNTSFNKERLQHYLQYYVLRADEKYSESQARGNNKMMPLPHQIEAVYSRMLQSPQVRYLLADDPGAGKTIMSGMLLRELMGRDMVERVLILVPPLVLKQWQEELREKFSEDFVIVNRTLLNSAGDMNPFETHDKLLASLYWASREEVKNLILKANFDLVIVDEAHKMAAYTHGVKKKKVQRTKMFQLGETLLRHTEHCLLLTATPHKGDKENFRHLMSLIDHDIFSKLNSSESLFEKSNPFVIRRLKEAMVKFDGTPLFPKRTTKTLGFDLSKEEIELYEEVTEYVREHFNRAKQNNKPSVAFAMMLLQRRLSSSVEAIYLSLVRRKERLEEVMTQERKSHQLDIDPYEELSPEEQEELEMNVEGETDTLDLAELQLEIDVLSRLIRKTNQVRQSGTERKYMELERTLFGPDGLLAKGEKILIFTESKDTLYFLEQRLLGHVPEVTKIIGNYSMDKRREQVERFRNEAQVMLATDAGGESINLQFCNQMINYDIPWNPNRLEQRMGRIHRIGQKNEVFIFNLVATNTREGDVLTRLLTKLEMMREDLGQELVYDFIGDVLEEQSVDLSSLMEEAISGREHLDDIIARMEKTLSEEHKRLLELTKNERVDEQSFDLPGMRRAHHERTITSLPARVYGEFVVKQFETSRIRLNVSHDRKIARIERFPKNIREFARKQKIMINTEESTRFALQSGAQKEGIELIRSSEPVYKLSMTLAANEVQQIVLPVCLLIGNVTEPLTVELSEVRIVDGTGRELEQKLLLLAKRADGRRVTISPYLLFESELRLTNANISEQQGFKGEVIQQARKLLRSVQLKRDHYVNRKSMYLRKAFDEQMNTLQERLQQYESNNEDNRNSALINQTYTQIEDLEERSRERLDEMERERSIQLRPVKRLAQIRIEPLTETYPRLIPEDVYPLIKQYELENGRVNVTAQSAFGLIDFTSETPDGEIRLILVTTNINELLNHLRIEDYEHIRDSVYVYELDSDSIMADKSLSLLISESLF
ncbi:DEAD/DEAH box helicase [Halalkalibacter krulwichiae]|uniref:RNA polymerase-associated protein RapA n=1 Tax=Halalkalibacter krulwichiae TaxID=199441 RepID=A0A1X9MBY8_9BACI|nr:helicase-related protein [Halalkalibacter krulwichiae]ARK30110.1 RNA polymerase-associated protein RapA [Halalkalibacter krulwichiae]